MAEIVRVNDDLIDNCEADLSVECPKCCNEVDMSFFSRDNNIFECENCGSFYEMRLKTIEFALARKDM